MAGTTEVDNKVTLNGVDYAIRGPVRQQPASEFQAGLRTGSPQYDNREGASFRNYNDFRGGLGVRIGDVREFPDRFWSSRAIRTWDSVQDITLAPLLTETASFDDPALATMVHPDDSMIFELLDDEGTVLPMEFGTGQLQTAMAWAQESSGSAVHLDAMAAAPQQNLEDRRLPRRENPHHH